VPPADFQVTWTFVASLDW
jgi:hypothetical protein